MVESHTTSHIHESVQKSLQANKEHQQALNAYIAKLEAELKTVEKLIVRFLSSYYFQSDPDCRRILPTQSRKSLKSQASSLYQVQSER